MLEAVAEDRQRTIRYFSAVQNRFERRWRRRLLDLSDPSRSGLRQAEPPAPPKSDCDQG